LPTARARADQDDAAACRGGAQDATRANGAGADIIYLYRER